MRETQIYIEDERIDLYPDETIELTSSIQDAKDIGKIFTDFSYDFDVPASPNNNEIFRHFYNFNISTGNFDARVRHKSNIYLNHLLFKRGRLFLNHVKMKNNKPDSYNLNFFGNTISLKDTFGDDKIMSLFSYDKGLDGSAATYQLSEFDHDFNHNNVRTIFSGTGMTVHGDNSALIYPLITSEKRLFYDSSIGNTDKKNFDGNLYRPSSGGDIDQYRKRGVKESDLKPAIKVYYIIKAIEEKYNINFIPDDTSAETEDFFSEQNDAFSNLYLWMSNGRGNITGVEGETEYLYKTKITSLPYNSSLSDTNRWSEFLSTSNGEIVLDNYSYLNDDGTTKYIGLGFFFDVYPDSSYLNVNYKIVCTNKRTGYQFSFTGKGNSSEDMHIHFQTQDYYEGMPKKDKWTIHFYSETAMEDTEIRFYLRGIDDDWNIGSLVGNTAYDYQVYSTGSTIDTNTIGISIENIIPDIKVMDFMDGLFKMFNLTAYYIDDETDDEYGDGETPVVKVITLDRFYERAINNYSGGMIDITEHIEVDEHVVNTSLPFNEVDMKFQETDVVLMDHHTKAFGEIFGNSHLPVNRLYPEFFFGDKYEIKLPFSKIKYERLDGTDIQWGYSAGGNFNTTEADYSDTNDIVPPTGNYSPQSIKPLLFYGVRHTGISQNINFSDDSNTVSTAVTSYYRPSNTNGTNTVSTPVQTINFDLEVDEYTGQQPLSTLFRTYYQNYIESVFDASKRISVFTAYLPPNFLIHYRLNDQLKIQDEVYRINTIRTNISTGKSKLELINLAHHEIIEPRREYIPIITDVDTTEQSEEPQAIGVPKATLAGNPYNLWYDINVMDKLCDETKTINLTAVHTGTGTYPDIGDFLDLGGEVGTFGTGFPRRTNAANTSGLPYLFLKLADDRIYAMETNTCKIIAIVSCS